MSDPGPLFIQPPPRKSPPQLTRADGKRLGRQLAAVRDVMLEKWPGGYFGAWSLKALKEELARRGVFATETSISARIRELPDLGLDYEKWQEPSIRGLWLYRLTGEVVEPQPKPQTHKCPHCDGQGVVP